MEFKFNENGVCLNPIVYFKEDEKKNISVKISLGKIENNEWAGAISYHSINSGASGPVSIYERNTFKDMRECFIFNFERLKEITKHSELHKQLHKLCDELKEENFPEEVQLKLFD